MAPKKVSKPGKSAKYYRENPEARKKKAKTDKKINARASQRKKRSELSTKRRQLKKKGVNLIDKDISHTKNGLVLKKSSVNRGSKSDTKGDREARGGKKYHKYNRGKANK